MNYGPYPYGLYGPFGPYGPFEYPLEIRDNMAGLPFRGGFREPSPYNPSGEMRGGISFPENGRIDRYPPPFVDDRFYMTRGGGSCGGAGFRGQSLSPESFAATDLPTAATQSPLEITVLGELSRSAKVLRELGVDLNSSDFETRKTSFENAKAQFYYTCGLLYSRGIFIPQETLTRGSSTPSRAGDGCERLGREIDRLLGGRGGGDGGFERLGRIADAARECFRGLQNFDPAGDAQSSPLIVSQPLNVDANPEDEVENQ